MYDLTGEQAHREGERRRANAAGRADFLAQPHNIRTMIHEAVHQIGINTGMHSRYVRSPSWIYEGLATFHEVPVPGNRFGWTIGPHVNHHRLERLRQYLSKPHTKPPIQEMIKNDILFRQPATVLDNYALAWGLTYYLDRRRRNELVAYLKLLQEKPIISEDSAEIRIRDFEACFGSDWDRLYRDFLDFLRRL